MVHDFHSFLNLCSIFIIGNFDKGRGLLTTDAEEAEGPRSLFVSRMSYPSPLGSNGG